MRRAGMHAARRGAAQGGVAFGGNFAALFPGAIQVAQSDMGLSYGGTMLATGTVPPVITITGALLGVPVPITVTDVVPGILGTWTGNVSYDGGSTQSQSFTSAGTVALTGKGAGLILNIGLGAAAGDNVWKATCAGLLDQSGNGKHFTQSTASLQPIIRLGLNGRCSLLFDGVDDHIDSTAGLPDPSVTPYYLFAVFRQITAVVSGTIFGNQGVNQNCIFQIPNDIFQRVNSVGPSNSGAALNAWVEMEIARTNNASDPYKLGITTVTGIVGTGALTSLNFGLAGGGGGNATSFEWLAWAATAKLPNWAAIRAAVASKYGATVLV